MLLDKVVSTMLAGFLYLGNEREFSVIQLPSNSRDGISHSHETKHSHSHNHLFLNGKRNHTDEYFMNSEEHKRLHTNCYIIHFTNKMAH